MRTCGIYGDVFHPLIPSNNTFTDDVLFEIGFRAKTFDFRRKRSIASVVLKEQLPSFFH